MWLGQLTSQTQLKYKVLFPSHCPLICSQSALCIHPVSSHRMCTHRSSVNNINIFMASSRIFLSEIGIFFSDCVQGDEEHNGY